MRSHADPGWICSSATASGRRYAKLSWSTRRPCCPATCCASRRRWPTGARPVSRCGTPSGVRRTTSSWRKRRSCSCASTASDEPRRFRRRSSGFSGPVPPAAMHRSGDRRAAGDVELGVEVRGEGVPVLFVHGFPFDRTVWRHQLAMLSRVKRIAPDLRGVGASGAPASDGYTLVRYADDLVAVLDALGIRAAVLCGLSMGGYVVFELLRRHAERVRAIILADTKAEPDSAEGKRGRDELAALAERQGQDAVIDRLLPRLLAPATLGTQPEVVAQVREMARRWTVPGLVGALRTLRDRPDST